MKLVALPRDPNPYQRLLYDEMQLRGVEVAYGGRLTGSRSLNLLLLPLELAVRRVAGTRLLHLHWVFGFQFAGSSRIRALRRVSELWFVLMLGIARALGMRIVWTAHNVLPHSQVFDDDVRARRALVRASDLVIAHSSGTLDELEHMGALPRQAAIIPSGPLVERSDIQDLRAAGARDGPRTVLFFGKIEPYKGVEELLQAVAGLPPATPVNLVIAGACRDEALLSRIHALTADLDRVDLRIGHVPDDEMPRLMSAADVVVLPFRKCTTSGSVATALAYGRPVVVPSLAAFDDLPDSVVTRYDGSVDGLRRAIADMCSRDSRQLAVQGVEARAYGVSDSWARASELTLAAIDDMPKAVRELRRPSVFRRGAGLIRNASFLMLNTLIGAGFGFVFTVVLTRLYDPRHVGLVTTALAAAALVTGLSSLGFNYALVQFLPTTVDRSRLITAAAILVSGTSLTVSGVLLLIPAATGKLFALGGAWFVLVFVVGNTVAALKGLAETVLIADRDAGTILRTNGLVHPIRLVFLGALAVVGPIGAYAAQPLAFAIGLGLMIMHLRRRSGWRLRIRHSLIMTQPMLRMAGGSYASTLVGGLPAMLLPLIVLSRFGADQAAVWNIAMLVALLVFSLPSSLGQSLFAEGTNAPGEQRRLVGRAARFTALTMTPLLLIGIVGAPLLLHVFGAGYADDGTGAMRLLIASGALVAINFVTGTVLFWARRIAAIVVINVVNLAIVCLYASLVAESATGVATGWVLGELVNVVLFGALAWRIMSSDRFPAGAVA